MVNMVFNRLSGSPYDLDSPYGQKRCVEDYDKAVAAGEKFIDIEIYHYEALRKSSTKWIAEITEAAKGANI